mmetsp:Transcript_26521/g.56989  ORF Transcript_26521/g.56989 Transcript_26521/m.56989 type:complete len:111 (-) Transcript_26521:94-426(-)
MERRNKQEYNDGELLSKKHCVPSGCITMINSPSLQRPRTSADVGVVVLNNNSTTCLLCKDEFSPDTNNCNENIKRHLPVLGTCNHAFCHGCIVNQQTARAEGKKGKYHIF